MTLGEKLSKLRKEYNYTQEQLAYILGVSRQSISKWESDIAYPETDKLVKWESSLNAQWIICLTMVLPKSKAQPPPKKKAFGMCSKSNSTNARAKK